MTTSARKRRRAQRLLCVLPVRWCGCDFYPGKRKLHRSKRRRVAPANLHARVCVCVCWLVCPFPVFFCFFNRLFEGPPLVVHRSVGRSVRRFVPLFCTAVCVWPGQTHSHTHTHSLAGCLLLIGSPTHCQSGHDRLLILIAPILPHTHRNEKCTKTGAGVCMFCVGTRQ